LSARAFLTLEDRKFYREAEKNIMVAPIIGDLDKVFVLNTRLGIIIDPKSNLAKILQELYRIQENIQGLPNQVTKRAMIILIVRLLKLYLDKQHYSERVNFTVLWKNILENFYDTFIESDSKIHLPDRIEEFVTRDNRFDASEYWRNWDLTR
jgi:hypothetical protein